jgi:hypothetical protein
MLNFIADKKNSEGGTTSNFMHSMRTICYYGWTLNWNGHLNLVWLKEKQLLQKCGYSV